MGNNKKHVPDYEISTYGEGFFTYTGNSANSIDALNNIRSRRNSQTNTESDKGGTDGKNNRTNK
jgi:hypothetical protein